MSERRFATLQVPNRLAEAVRARAATRQRLEEKLETRIRRAGGAFVHSTRELSASAYGFPVELQPSRAPCSTHDDHLTPTALLHWEGAAAGPLASSRDMAGIFQARSVVEGPPRSSADGRRAHPWPRRSES